ncbi:hypothetical protein OG250_46245 [Streptomyces sp. NBC_00487]|nr:MULTISPECIES: hypothetical protein [unclassified Streptomyces]WRY93304.1 hypothetical protein OG889_00360 [Streptomyces sp. NBC_00481]
MRREVASAFICSGEHAEVSAALREAVDDAAGKKRDRTKSIGGRVEE